MTVPLEDVMRKILAFQKSVSYLEAAENNQFIHYGYNEACCDVDELIEKLKKELNGISNQNEQGLFP